MPGGYGTVDTPWGTAGDRGPVKSPVSTPSRQITLPPVVSDAEIAASGTQQPTTQFANIPSGNIPGTPLKTPPQDYTYNMHGDNPYYPTGNIQTSQILPEQKPLTQPSKFMFANVIADEIAKNPKYWEKSFEGKQGIPPNTLGKIIAVDSRGNPILDSSGNPIYTRFGKDVVDRVSEGWDPDNPIDITLPGAFEEHIANYEELDKYERDFWRDQPADEGGGWQPQRQMGQRERNLALLRFLQGGSPIKQLEQSGFMGSMKDPYAEPMKIAGEKGIFSGVSGTGITGEAMKRLLKSWGSGYSSPRYANVARGGIMSAWNDMRR